LTDKAKVHKIKFYVSHHWNKEYNTRLPLKREQLEAKFGDKFDWDLDGPVVKELLRAELELTHLDRIIVNEATKQEDGFLFVPKHLLNQRTDLRKALSGYRKTLMLDMEVRVRNKVKVTGKVSQKDRWRAALAKANEDDLQP
jgi:hypothetical protein